MVMRWFIFGGIYLDFDILTIAPHAAGEWIGTDSASDDNDWTFANNTYFPNGSMKFNYKNEWMKTLVNEIVQNYQPDCWNCKL